jgi:hypothetical protein
VNDAEVQALWQAGSLRSRVRWLIASAWLLTFAIAIVGGRVMWKYTWGYHGQSGYRSVLAIVVALGLALALMMPMRGSRWIRAAVALPFVQAIALLCAWGLWNTIDPSALPLALTARPAFVVVSFVLAYAIVARVVARRGERLHAGVMLALANLLAVGLWIPIASRFWCEGHPGRTFLDYVAVDDHLAALALVLFGPPFAAACTFTAFHFLRRRVPSVHSAVAVVFVAALASSKGRLPIHDYAVGQLVHVVLAIALVAVGAIGALAAATAYDAARGRRRLARGLVGTVRCSEPFAAALTIGSWLRGPQQVLVPFAIDTEHGELPVPGGARWLGPVPEATTRLGRGDAAVVLRDGDGVLVSGFVEAAQRDPFRTARVWLPTGEVRIGRIADAMSPTQIGYALWRPCVAFLAIAIGVGVPALVAALCAL